MCFEEKANSRFLFIAMALNERDAEVFNFVFVWSFVFL